MRVHYEEGDLRPKDPQLDPGPAIAIEEVYGTCDMDIEGVNDLHPDLYSRSR